MYTITAENIFGEMLTLTEYRSAYQVTYTGLGPVAAEVVMSRRGMVNGEKHNSSHVGKRNIVLYVFINGNVEANRIRLYRWFSPEMAVKLHYKNGSRDVYTEGVVESFEVDQFEEKQRAQISILCPEPYLTGAEEIVKNISGVVDMFEFPFAIEAEGIPFSDLAAADYALLHNDGDTSTGFVTIVRALEDVVNPMIYNTLTSEALRIKGTLLAGHMLTIDTRIGRKRITITSPGGEVKSAFSRKMPGSVWLQLVSGDNYISFAADSGVEGMLVTLHYNNLFVGV